MNRNMAPNSIIHDENMENGIYRYFEYMIIIQDLPE